MSQSQPSPFPQFPCFVLHFKVKGKQTQGRDHHREGGPAQAPLPPLGLSPSSAPLELLARRGPRRDLSRLLTRVGKSNKQPGNGKTISKLLLFILLLFCHKSLPQVSPSRRTWKKEWGTPSEVLSYSPSLRHPPEKSGKAKNSIPVT